MCTSGSSGSPKLAHVSHRQQLQSYTWVNEFNRESFVFNTTGPYWLTFYNSLILHSLNTQKRLVTSKDFTTDLCFDMIEKYKINSIFVLPPYLSLIIESPRFATADWSCVKFFITGGLCVSANLRNKIQDKLTNGLLKIGYGMTGGCF
jgi:acyl-coenzyme A synthetase/AMP-(fatty) acid ligase